jgi:hypothetical protein
VSSAGSRWRVRDLHASIGDYSGDFQPARPAFLGTATSTLGGPRDLAGRADPAGRQTQTGQKLARALAGTLHCLGWDCPRQTTGVSRRCALPGARRECPAATGAHPAAAGFHDGGPTWARLCAGLAAPGRGRVVSPGGVPQDPSQHAAGGDRHLGEGGAAHRYAALYPVRGRL